jgi:hypothetical protein
VSDAKADAMRATLNGEMGSLSFKPGAVFQNHMGVRFVAVPLETEKHPDGYSYTAYLPVGALSPTAPQMNPELVKQMYIERTGGLAGLTESTGPIDIKTAGND